MKYILLTALILASGCSTLSVERASTCEIERKSFLFIVYDKDIKCLVTTTVDGE